MVRRCLFVLSVLVLALGAVPASAAPAAGYTGIVKLSNCSGALVRMPGARDTDPALVLTNGHCDEAGMPGPGEVVLDRPARRSMSLLAADGHELGTLNSTKIVYATMTDTDVALYQLDSSYRQISSRLGGNPLTVAASPADVGTPVSVISGYFRRTWTCSIERVLYSLREADWTWKNSIRYTPECATIHGTSGSPVVDAGTGEVVGVNNTGNDDGYSCTLDNPCEVDEQGVVTVLKGRSYGQQTYLLAACVRSSEIQLDRLGCELPKPAALTLPSAA
ncbi:serine protease [Amycolatopsis acidiphila]|uniref:Trypsin-like peptidase domain-containing protein n=1 Tax=Amycolatopsis acidiphila TaxID=715473 RepID=A0A557ZXM4_9PSEU|nr:serine protease [Amycolatopsis acidiphila]TVT16746.1 trypsin-like peptidase domain-containing protein [Amycolatopsis acidiphila]UIJ59464.1 serine protease [Amycolatopsis acidiphila]GHG94656.1 serine protease [Amycolatopsis acidiphila]